MRDFLGMQNNTAREVVNDDEFYWCENIIPLASGNLSPVAIQSSVGAGPLTGDANNPTYTTAFTISVGGVATNYVFAAFSATGNGWIVNLTTLAATKIIAGLLSSTGGTFATQYGNQGLLIIDPNGYWDYNVTTANTLTSQVNSISRIVVGYLGQLVTSVVGGTVLKGSQLSVGTGGSVRANYQVISVTINAAGTGYVIGDSLTLTDGGSSVPAQIIVAAVGGGGAITGITLPVGGSYPGPVATNAAPTTLATGPTGNVVSGGTGTGATFKVTVQAFSGTIIAAGSGYQANFINQDSVNPAGPVITNYTDFSSGVIGGTSIATYATRVWIGKNRTIYVTDVDSYNSFGGAGTNFTINDAYLHNTITCLVAANNYLYIFGDTSIDALSNVAVSATTGLTSFSRINITTSVGTSAPSSVFGYYRGLVFYHASGIYLLAGATPEKISEKISGIIRNVTAATQMTAVGCAVLVQGELCIAMQLFIADVFTQGGTIRPIVVLYFRGRWWVYSFYFNVTTPAMVSISVGGVLTLYAWGGSPGNAPTLFQAFSGALSPWLVLTKLWDGGAALSEKQPVNAAIAGVLTSTGSSGVTFTIDTELGSSVSQSFPATGAQTGYRLLVQQAQQGSATGPAQYLGLTLSGIVGGATNNMHLLALRGKTERGMMQ